MSRVNFNELLPILEDTTPYIQTSTTTVAARINDPTKAPGRFPYPLDTIMEDLAEAYLILHNAKEKLNIASTNVALDKPKKEQLKLFRDKMQTSAKMVREVAEVLELNFTLDK